MIKIVDVTPTMTSLTRGEGRINFDAEIRITGTDEVVSVINFNLTRRADNGTDIIAECNGKSYTRTVPADTPNKPEINAMISEIINER